MVQYLHFRILKFPLIFSALFLTCLVLVLNLHPTHEPAPRQVRDDLRRWPLCQACGPLSKTTCSVEYWVAYDMLGCCWGWFFGWSWSYLRVFISKIEEKKISMQCLIKCTVVSLEGMPQFQIHPFNLYVWRCLERILWPGGWISMSATSFQTMFLGGIGQKLLKVKDLVGCNFWWPSNFRAKSHMFNAFSRYGSASKSLSFFQYDKGKPMAEEFPWSSWGT